jgi:hypothetical protein
MTSHRETQLGATRGRGTGRVSRKAANDATKVERIRSELRRLAFIQWGWRRFIRLFWQSPNLAATQAPQYQNRASFDERATPRRYRRHTSGTEDRCQMWPLVAASPLGGGKPTTGQRSESSVGIVVARYRSKSPLPVVMASGPGVVWLNTRLRPKFRWP